MATSVVRSALAIEFGQVTGQRLMSGDAAGAISFPTAEIRVLGALPQTRDLLPQLVQLLADAMCVCLGVLTARLFAVERAVRQYQVRGRVTLIATDS